MLVDVLNPERIVIGGMALRLGGLLFEPARNVMQQEALKQCTSVCEVVPARLGERGQDAEGHGPVRGGGLRRGRAGRGAHADGHRYDGDG